ncbi:hypothetical protein E2C01_043438 [Portunus trituberculatus]|uniref:Uncharacterized protein n=1 Tax=Portunus trituberculatus TaxID=210409 RepID=A0A5B7FPI3_PORTR|nr:hypothetical protein [Portunus trituberculatus]
MKGSGLSILEETSGNSHDTGGETSPPHEGRYHEMDSDIYMSFGSDVDFSESEDKNERKKKE